MNTKSYFTILRQRESMSFSNIKEGEEKQEDGRQKTHNCGGVEM